MFDVGLLQEAIQKIANPIGLNNIRLCLIKTVDTSKLTCSVTPIDNQDIIIYNVLLACTDQPTFALIPVVGSQVIVGWSNSNIPFIMMFSQVEQYFFGTSDDTLYKLLDDTYTQILAIGLQTSQGPTVPNSVINTTEFQQLAQRNKKLFLK